AMARVCQGGLVPGASTTAARQARCGYGSCDLRPRVPMVHKWACLWAAVLALPLAARADPGDLDPSFGAGGQVSTPILSGYDGASAVVVQPDGKLVAAGHADNANNATFALVRYNAAGSLDTSFGTGGKVTTAIGSTDDEVLALVLQPDGKLVAAGFTASAGNTAFALVRYNADGSLDTSFGTGGKVTTSIGSVDDKAIALVLQPDGKLVAAGYSYNGTDTDFALARYLGQVCGDGIVEASEQCDAGAANGEHTSCCTTTCQFTASGTSCDDGNSCTYNE